MVLDLSALLYDLHYLNCVVVLALVARFCLYFERTGEVRYASVIRHETPAYVRCTPMRNEASCTPRGEEWNIYQSVQKPLWLMEMTLSKTAHLSLYEKMANLCAYKWVFSSWREHRIDYRLPSTSIERPERHGYLP